MKHINDTFGHQAGNHALVETASVLRDSFRQSDILGRYGGDEFAILISNAVEDSAAIVVERLQAKLHARNTQPDRRYLLSFSVGIVTSDATQPPDLGQLLHQADALMYQYKRERQLVRR
jgi:diguanylate cyclase (GGDEF)-like protein